ncbi:hypothetical protein AAZV13_12G051100 [Glycine max]
MQPFEDIHSQTDNRFICNFHARVFVFIHFSSPSHCLFVAVGAFCFFVPSCKLRQHVLWWQLEILCPESKPYISHMSSNVTLLDAAALHSNLLSFLYIFPLTCLCCLS